MYIYESFVIICLMGSGASVILKIPPSYLKDIKPPSSHGPLNVSVQIYINDMVPLKTINMHYSIDIFFRQYWKDIRLNFDNESRTKKPVIYSEIFYNEIWTPDTFFPLVKKAKVNYVTKPNRLFMIDSYGNIFYSQRISLEVYCQMNLYNFPFDTQTCYFTIESYGHNQKNLRLLWNYNEEGPVYPPKSPNMLEFTLKSISHGRNRTKYIDYFDKLFIEFKFQRNYGYYLLQMYLPCNLVVVLSWVGFWIDYRSTPARVSIGITTVLTMITLGNSIRTSVPQVDHSKSLDNYVILCLCYVFATLVEYAIIGVVDNKRKRFLEETNARNNSQKNSETTLMKSIFQGFKRKNSSTDNTDPVDSQCTSSVPSESTSNSTNNYHWPRTRHVINHNSTREKNTRAPKFSQLVAQLTKNITDNNNWERQLHHDKTHFIDRIMRKLLPLTFLIFNISYFSFSLKE